MGEPPRCLEVGDYYKGYLPLLNQLTTVNLNTTFEEFETQFNNVTSKIFVIEHANQIIATGSLLIEKKFIRNFMSVGHIEDIVVQNEFRGRGLGISIVNFLTKYARDNDCYKVILDCDSSNIEFYKKCGYTPKDTHMVLYF